MNETTVVLTYQFSPLNPDGSTRVTARLSLQGQNPEGGSGVVNLCLDELERLRHQPDAYRALLTKNFFEKRPVYTPLVQARMAQRAGGVMLHIRFEIPKDAVRLHAVLWELLGDPDGENEPPLGRGERVFFSRILLPSNPRQHATGPRRVKAVAVIANPRLNEDGHPLRFDSIDVDAEQSLVDLHLRGKSDLRRTLIGPDASWTALASELSSGCDILYLACHGTLIEDQPQIYLEGPEGNAIVISAESFAQRSRESLCAPPRLVVLAACQSSGGGALSDRDDQGFLCAFAARLVDAGVLAVVGMQGNVSQETSLAFATKLFSSVLTDGQIERAVSLARADVQGRSDWWLPVLVMSPSSGGALWQPRPEFKSWKELLLSFSTEDCLPILGPGIVAELSNLNFAQHLVKKMGGARLMGRNPEPSKIAQEYKVLNSLTDDRGGIETEMRNFVQATLTDVGIWPKRGENLDVQVRRWGDGLKGQKTGRILAMLASLPAPVFLTTNGDSLLQQAMEARDPAKSPETEILPWRGEIAKIQELKDEREGPDLPTCERPLVHHLFGHFREPGSLVITEDDFFDYLIWLVANRQLVWIRTKLCDSSLLFMGFRLEDWEFRLLLRSIAKLQGSENLKTKTHVAVQIEDSGEPDQREQVKAQLESYFKNSDVTLSIFWGTAEEFLDDLLGRLKNAGLLRDPALTRKQLA